MMLLKILEWPVGWMQRQIEQISGFLWHYYLVLFLTVAVFSSVTSKICASVEADGQLIRAEKCGSVQCLEALNEITSHVRR